MDILQNLRTVCAYMLDLLFVVYCTGRNLGSGEWLKNENRESDD